MLTGEHAAIEPPALPSDVPRLLQGTIARRDLLILGGAALLAGCADKARAREIDFWAMGPEGEYAPVLVKPFIDAGHGHVATQAIPWTAAHQKVLTAFVGNSLPDVMMCKTSWLAELDLLGACAPLPLDSPLLAGHFAAARTAVTFGDRAVAVPWATDAWVQYYRRDLLAAAEHDAPPADWGDWLRMARAMKARRTDGHVTLHLIDWPEPLFAFAAQQPEPLLRDQDTRGNFRSAGFRDALARYKLIFDEGLSPVAQGSEYGDTLVALRRGQLSILPATATTIGDLGRRTAWFAPELWGIAPTPGPQATPRAVASGLSLVVNARARNPQGAWRLVEFMTQPASLARLYTAIGDLPTRAAAWELPAIASGVGTSVFRRHIDAGVVQPSVPEWERIVTEVQRVAERMARGAFGVDRAAAEMDARVDRILEKRRDLLSRGQLT